MASRQNVQYNRLALADDDEYYGDGRRRHDPRFDYFPRTLDKVPLKSICIAIFLLALGCFVLLLSYFIFTGQMGGEPDQAYGLLFIGIICIIPGFYVTRIAYYSWRGAQGYGFSLIPDY